MLGRSFWGSKLVHSQLGGLGVQSDLDRPMCGDTRPLYCVYCLDGMLQSSLHNKIINAGLSSISEACGTVGKYAKPINLRNDASGSNHFGITVKVSSNEARAFPFSKKISSASEKVKITGVHIKTSLKVS